MKIIREGDIVFLLCPGVGGHAINLKMISKIELYDPGVHGQLGLVIYSIGASPDGFHVTPDEARQLFMDTPWIKVLPARKP